MKIIDNTPIKDFNEDWGDPDGTGMKEKSKEQVQKFIKKKFIGLGYTFLGNATPSTVPATITIEDKFLYIATEEGDYTNFGLGNISELSVIKSESGNWSVEGLGVPFIASIKELASIVKGNKWQLVPDGEEVFGNSGYGYAQIGQYSKPMTSDFKVHSIVVKDLKNNSNTDLEVIYSAYIVTGKNKPNKRDAPEGLIEESTHTLITKGSFILPKLGDYEDYNIPAGGVICPKGSQVVVYMARIGSQNIAMRGSSGSGTGNEEGTSNHSIYCVTASNEAAISYGAKWSVGGTGYYNVALVLHSDSAILGKDKVEETVNDAIKSKVFSPLGDETQISIFKEYPKWYISANNRYVETNEYSGGYYLSMFELEPQKVYKIKLVNKNKYSASVGICAIAETSNLTSKLKVQVLASFKDENVSDVFFYAPDKKQYLLIEHYGECADIREITNPPSELYTPISKVVKEQIDDRMEDIISSVSAGINPSIHIQIPSVVYALVGLELNIWNDTLAFSMDKGLISPVNYHVEWSCAKGVVTSRGWRFTPKESDVGEFNNCTCKIYSTQNNILIDSKTFTLKVVDSLSLTQQKNILFCGDSLGGGTAYQIQDNISNFAGAKPNMIGNVAYKPYASQPPVYNLSYGGWSWKTFATAGVTKWRLQVTGVSSLSVNAKYKDSTNGLFTIEEVNTTDGSGNILVSKTYEKPYDYHDLTLPSGTLTKVSSSYSGDDTFTYTGEAEAGNPLWNADINALDFANYQSRYNLPSIDVVIFQLGINDNGMINNGDEMKGYIEALYDAYISYKPSGLFVLGITPQSGNDYNGLGVNYGAQSNVWGQSYARNMEKIRDLYISMYESGNYPRMRIIAENLFIDRYYGYGLSERDISARYSGEGRKEQYHNNYVHPVTSGYCQLADAITGGIVAIITE